MLHRKNNEWRLCTHKVTYMQSEEQYTTYAHDLSWWERFVGMWGHTKIISIEEVTPTKEQLARHKQIRYLPEDFGDVYSAFVENGEIIKGDSIASNHPFNLILLSNKKVPAIETDVQTVAEMTAYVLTDTTMVAELAAILLEDSTATAEVLATVLEKNAELEGRIERLEGGE